MKQRNELDLPEKRYTHKLNMMRPGGVMCLLIGVLLLAGLICLLCSVYTIGVVLCAAAMLLLVALIVLLAIEQHQDKVLYELAKEQDEDIK